MNPLDLIDQLIAAVTVLKGPKLLIVTLIALGYGIQKMPGIPNHFIPRFVVIGGMVLAPVLVAWPTPETMEPGVRFNLLAAWVQVCAQGFLLGAGAWFLHAKFLKKWIDEKWNGTGKNPGA